MNGNSGAAAKALAGVFLVRRGEKDRERPKTKARNVKRKFRGGIE